MKHPMNITCTALVILLTAASLWGQAPVVDNVRFEQRTDGSLTVDIYYDLSDTDGETKKVIIEASADNGATWTLACNSLSGDVGSDITLGTDKHVIWDFYADHPNVSGDAYMIRVTALETGTMTDRDGNVYQTVKIGDQWWMAENLRVTHYEDGYPIGYVENQADWSMITGGAYAFYDDMLPHIDTYGLLYNWHAVANDHHLAPAGWHVPTDEDWTTLTDYLGSDGASKLAGNAALWNDGALKSNAAFGESGFTALPAGCRDGSFLGKGVTAYFWSSTESSSGTAWFRALTNTSSEVLRFDIAAQRGAAVRLVRNY